MRLVACALLSALASALVGGESPTLADGAVVALVGDGVIERDRAEGRLAAAIVGAQAAAVVVRNLGWSGDRSDLAARPDGLRKLSGQLADLKPALTLLMVGANDVDDPAGVPARLEASVAALAPVAGRLVLCTPLPQQRLARLADATDTGKPLAAIAGAVKALAAKQGLACVDLHQALLAEWSRPEPELTTDGMRPNACGYRRVAAALARGLGWSDGCWTAQAEAGTVRGEGLAISAARASAQGIAFTALAAALPPASARCADVGALPSLRVASLAPGRWRLSVDGAQVAVADAAAWAQGVAIADGPDFAQAEELRAHLARSAFWWARGFHPENWHKRHFKYLEASLPGYAKNAGEHDAKAAALRAPKPHRYEIARVEDAK